MKLIKGILKKILDVGLQVQLKLGAICLLLIIVTITLGIISRYVFNSPYVWTEELGVILFVWIAFLGAGVAAARNRHVAINLLSQKLPPKIAVVLEFILNILILVFLIIMIFGALKLQAVTANHKSVTLDIPKNVYYLAPLVSGIYMVLVYIYRSMDLVERGADALQDSSRSAEM
ncbi:MAG: TRAP transporter small permease [Bacillota bacterium]|nr:TRAP transporter small permease [Bacillota bacterium]